jgi:AraC family transcriptional regulator
VAIVRTLYESPLMRIGDFHCRGGDPRWRACNSIGEGHHLVFPRTAVFIAHEGGQPVLADPSVAVVYRSHERYRRVIADPAGDHCVWVVPSVELEPLDGQWPVPRFVRTGRRAYATQTLVAWTLAHGGPIDPLVVEEEMLGVVADALGRVEEPPPPARTASCDEAVEQVRAILASRYAERLSLGAVAREVHVSPFHLTRRFRARTGRSLHQYRNEVRLRRSLQLVCDGFRVDIGHAAAAVGYSSHSHFCTSFRRAFGLAPSRLRRSTDAELRKNLKAIAAHQP